MTGSLTENINSRLFRHLDGLNISSNHWYDTDRERLRDSWSQFPEPNRKDESWKYNAISRFGASADKPLTELGCTVSGVSELTLEEIPRWAVEPVKRLSQLRHPHAFGALSRLKVVRPKIILIENSGAVRMKFHSQSSDSTETSVVFVIVRQGVEATLVEECDLDGSQTSVSSVLRIYLENEAKLEHLRTLRGSERSFHLQESQTVVEAKAQYQSANFVAQGWAHRIDQSIQLLGEEASCGLNGIYFSSGEGEIDFHTNIVHAAEGSRSQQYLKGIVSGKSRTIFNGRVEIQSQAQKSNAAQLSRVLMLSDTCEVNSKPELDIGADDVKATHGSSIGQVDGDQVFYLRSRGLTADESKQIVLRGYFSDVLDQIGSKLFVEELTKLIHKEIEKSK